MRAKFLAITAIVTSLNACSGGFLDDLTRARVTASAEPLQAISQYDSALKCLRKAMYAADGSSDESVLIYLLPAKVDQVTAVRNSLPFDFTVQANVELNKLSLDSFEVIPYTEFLEVMAARNSAGAKDGRAPAVRRPNYYFQLQVVDYKDKLSTEDIGGNVDAAFGKGTGATNIGAAGADSRRFSRISLAGVLQSGVDGKTVRYAGASYSATLEYFSTSSNVSILVGGNGLGGNRRAELANSEMTALGYQIQLVALQTIGRLYFLPWWKCTKNGTEEKNELDAIRDEYVVMRPQMQNELMAMLLRRHDHNAFNGKKNIDSKAIRQAMTAFVKNRNLSIDHAKRPQDVFAELVRTQPM